MVTVIEDKRDVIEQLCRRFGVSALYLFGSAARGDFRPGESDIDLLVDFGDMDGRSKAHAYFELLDALEDALGTRVDLVMVGAVKNRFLAREIELTKQRLYAA
jgi:predicted nucleotidyltransferase